MSKLTKPLLGIIGIVAFTITFAVLAGCKMGLFAKKKNTKESVKTTESVTVGDGVSAAGAFQMLGEKINNLLKDPPKEYNRLYLTIQLPIRLREMEKASAMKKIGLYQVKRKEHHQDCIKGLNPVFTVFVSTQHQEYLRMWEDEMPLMHLMPSRDENWEKVEGGEWDTTMWKRDLIMD